MKIFYTKKFKEELEKPYRQLVLGKYKLRNGEVLFDKLTSDNVTSWDFLSSCSPTSFGEERFYYSQAVKYNRGIQLSLEIPETDASVYTKAGKDSFYQVILFYFTDTTTDKSSLAFLVFEDFGKNGFSGLNITSRRNIITIPELSWKCSLEFYESEFTNILENPWGQGLNEMTALGKDKKYTEDYEYISVDSWKRFFIDKISSEGETDWIETVYINNFGLKIY